MAKFQFRKRKKLAPGLYLNISRNGFGVSAGPKGAKISKSATGRITGSVGVPGSGISYRRRLSGSRKDKSSFPGKEKNGILSDIQDKTSYIAVHGNVLSSSEIRRALAYLLCLLFISLAIPFGFLNQGPGIPILLWIIFAFLYTRESLRNKRKWKERTKAHLAVCEHLVDSEILG